MVKMVRKGLWFDSWPRFAWVGKVRRIASLIPVWCFLSKNTVSSIVSEGLATCCHAHWPWIHTRWFTFHAYWPFYNILCPTVDFLFPTIHASSIKVDFLFPIIHLLAIKIHFSLPTNGFRLTTNQLWLTKHESLKTNNCKWLPTNELWLATNGFWLKKQEKSPICNQLFETKRVFKISKVLKTLEIHCPANRNKSMKCLRSQIIFAAPQWLGEIAPIFHQNFR